MPVRSQGDGSVPRGPHYHKRVLDLQLLKPKTRLRRYYYEEGWHHVDYVVERPPFKSGGVVYVDLSTIEAGIGVTMYAADMGIVPTRRGRFNSHTYTVLLDPS